VSASSHALDRSHIPRLLLLITCTATGFSNPVRVVFQAIIQSNITEDPRQTVVVHFRIPIHRQREEIHVMDRIFLRPLGSACDGLRISWQACITAA
jgi:hypothetical protein